MMKPTLALLFAAACGSDHPQQPDASVAVDAPPPPTLRAVARQTTVTRGQAVTIDVTVTSFVLIDPTKGRLPHPGEGHYHIYRDADAVNYDAGWTPQLDIASSTGDAPGDHQVRLVLVDGDHDPIAPTVDATVHFTLQ